MFPGGMIISFEGLDCSFKETNCKAFYKRLSESIDNDKKHVFFDSFPRYDKRSSFFVKKWLKGEYDRDYLRKYPYAINSFYSIDRLDYWFEEIEFDDLKNNRLYFYNRFRQTEEACFIFDRYNFSNAIYNPKNKRPSVKDFTFDYLNFGIPQPDIVVWMRMRDFNVLEDLVKGKRNKDKNEKDISFLKSAWKSSEFILKYNHPKDVGVHMVVIECLDQNGNIRSKEDIENDVWNKVMEEVNKVNEELKILR